MKLELPTLDLSPGRIMCLHMPRQFQAAGDTLEQDLLDFARRQGKAAILCQPAGFESRFLGPAWMMTGIGWFSRLIWRYPMRRRPGSQTSMEWFSRAAGISEEESGQIISGLCERVADKLDWNAGTPRCLLGIAAALAHQPDMVIYSAVGLDAQGCRKVHGYVAAKCSQLCVLHVSYPSEYGDGSPHPRDCPPGAGCITLAADTKHG